MPTFSLRSHLARFSMLSLIATGLSVGLLPTAPAGAFFDFGSYDVDERDYATCADNLLGKGISEPTAASACARALYPLDLSRCVDRIDSNNTLAATEVLSACQRVRRPLELATCYNEIETGDAAAARSDVLDHCRRSLLPERFSSCVVGLRRETTLSTASAMTTCIDAGDTLDAGDVPSSNPPTLTPL